MRALRMILGIVLSLLALLPLLVGGALLYSMNHRDRDGYFRAPLEPLRTNGYAIMIPNLTEFLDQKTGVNEFSQTEFEVMGRNEVGAAPFIGIASRTDVQRYLAGVSHRQVTDMDITGGTPPVTSEEIVGTQPPADPTEQTFWLEKSDPAFLTDRVRWRTSQFRDGQQLSLVIMNIDGSAGMDTRITAGFKPEWLAPTTLVFLVGGGLLLIGGLWLVFASRDNVEPGQGLPPSSRSNVMLVGGGARSVGGH